MTLAEKDGQIRPTGRRLRKFQTKMSLDVVVSLLENQVISHRIHVWYISYIYHKDQPNVGKYTIHGSYGFGFK